MYKKRCSVECTSLKDYYILIRPKDIKSYNPTKNKTTNMINDLAWLDKHDGFYHNIF